MQVDHVSLAVPYAKLEAEVAFLISSMAHMGFKECMRPHPAVVGMGNHSPFLWVSGVDNARNEIVEDGNRILKVHLAITAKDREQVDQFHKNALDAGGICNGKPGLRTHYHPNYYAAFVLDPCGNNIEVVVHQPQVPAADGE